MQQLFLMVTTKVVKLPLLTEKTLLKYLRKKGGTEVRGVSGTPSTRNFQL